MIPLPIDQSCQQASIPYSSPLIIEGVVKFAGETRAATTVRIEFHYTCRRIVAPPMHSYKVLDSVFMCNY